MQKTRFLLAAVVLFGPTINGQAINSITRDSIKQHILLIKSMPAWPSETGGDGYYLELLSKKDNGKLQTLLQILTLDEQVLPDPRLEIEKNPIICVGDLSVVLMQNLGIIKINELKSVIADNIVVTRDLFQFLNWLHLPGNRMRTYLEIDKLLSRRYREIEFEKKFKKPISSVPIGDCIYFIEELQTDSAYCFDPAHLKIKDQKELVLSSLLSKISDATVIVDPRPIPIHPEKFTIGDLAFVLLDDLQIISKTQVLSVILSRTVDISEFDTLYFQWVVQPGSRIILKQVIEDQIAQGNK